MANPDIQTIQLNIELWQFFLGIATFIFGLGVAWAKLHLGIKSLDKDVINLKDSFKYSSNKLTNALLSIKTNEKDIESLKIHTKYGKSNSPTVPNIKGQNLLKKSGFLKIYPDLKDKIFNTIKKNSPRTLYDVEQEAFLALYEFLKNPKLDPVKDYLVENPNLSLKTIFTIASWMIRDQYAKKYLPDKPKNKS